MHINVEIVRAKCSHCINQTIEVYILGQTLPLTINKEIIEMLENLKLIATLSNKQVGSTQTHHFQFQPKELKKISILFLSAGSCTLIYNMNISYFICERNIRNEIYLPETISPASGYKKVNVSCPMNRLNPRNEEPYGLCSSKGEWTIISGCMCKQGYSLDTTDEKCKSNFLPIYTTAEYNLFMLPCLLIKLRKPLKHQSDMHQLYIKFNASIYFYVM